ncbi:hypothetical protein [Anaeromassilibacillus senegalensis]|uniref:hypothetical protein n=1 Tax=Anaeromassilibacillus senegalensis TaxID=1673717 RepID=UPI0006806C62|nr:hypothetical protein [Anaeromassilibacillus senegalensis]
MNYCRINGQAFDVTVAISDIEETFNVLDGENAGRVMTGRMVRDIIGTYIGHKVTFFSSKSQKDFDALWDYLVAHSVDDSVQLEAADGQKSISYEAYYTSGTRTLKSAADGVNIWDEIEINFVPMDAQVKP